jgi:hypothetical protein
MNRKKKDTKKKKKKEEILIYGAVSKTLIDNNSRS